MKDNLDAYIGRCIKTWTARQPGRKEGRAELLRRAALPKLEDQQSVARFITSLQHRLGTNPEWNHPHSHINFSEPFTLTALQSFHMVADQRLAT